MAKSNHIKEQDGFATVTLASPATINGAKVDALRMREPTVSDMKAMQAYRGDDAEREIFGIASLCEITPAEVEALTLRNMGRLQEAFRLFTI